MRAPVIPTLFRRVGPTHLALSIALGLAGCGGGGGDDAGLSASATGAVEKAESQTAEQAKPKATVGSMAVARLDHTATLLTNGKVLVAGGFDGSNDLSSCELYDPATKRWSPGPEMKTTHRKARAVVLADGRVLMSGGGGHEIYDPATNAWTRVAEPERGRASHSATLLADGRVLVAGGIEYPVVDGFNLPGTATAEIYDPVLNTWSPAASMPIARRNHSATRLADGKVLLSGFRVYLAALSMNTAGAGGVILYDPANDTWTSAGDISWAQRVGLVASLPNGEVLTSGATLKLPANDWVATHGLGSDRPLDAPYVLLADGRLVTSGGGQSMRTEFEVELSARVDIFDPASNSWKPGRSLDAMRSQHTMTLLPDGKILVAGGRGADLLNQFQNNDLSPILRSAELLDPAAALRAPAKRSDLDGDGKSDILWRNDKTGAVQWWRMNGLQRLGSTRIRKGSDFDLASVGDIDGDGRADLAWSKEKATSLWLMKGAAALDKQNVTVYYAGQRASLADLNGDDRVEGFWLDNGKSPNIQQPKSIYDWSLDPEITGSVAGDFDGDRRSDLVLSDSRDGSTSIWYMMGTRWLTTKTVLSMNANLRAVAAADFNGDGKTDLLMANKANGSIAMWLMDGARIKSKRTLLNLSDWTFAASPDLNGDGKADIVWHSAKRGTTVAWLMNGSNVIALKTLLVNSDWTPVGP